jgi:hypothetical protein
VVTKATLTFAANMNKMEIMNKLSELALDLAKSKGFEGVSTYRVWNGFIVFEAGKHYKSDLSDIPKYLPFIIVSIKDNKARWASEEEASRITIYFQ